MLRIVPARPEDAGMARARLSPLDLNKYSLIEGGLTGLLLLLAGFIRASRRSGSFTIPRSRKVASGSIPWA